MRFIKQLLHLYMAVDVDVLFTMREGGRRMCGGETSTGIITVLGRKRAGKKLEKKLPGTQHNTTQHRPELISPNSISFRH